MNLEDELRRENATLEPNVTDEWLHGNVTADDTTDVTATISLGFVDSVIKSFSVMIVSELGDKTFFLAGEISVVDGFLCRSLEESSNLGPLDGETVKYSFTGSSRRLPRTLDT